MEEGLCGRTTVFEDELRENRKGVEALPMLLETHAPLEKVVLMLRTNDCKTVYQASAEVIFDPEFSQESVETSKRLKRVYQQIAEKNRCKFLAVSDYAKANEADRQHLDKDGHRRLAEAMYRKIT